MADIKFGTDGWRAIIAREYTFEKLGRVAAATARWMKASKTGGMQVVIGYDARFMSRDFAEFTARIMAWEGIQVQLSDAICPTPAVSLAAFEQQALGVVITASHNPPEYNGFKIKAPFGGSASPAQIREVEALIPDAYDTQALPELSALMAEQRIVRAALNARYLDILRERIDVACIRAAGIKIAHDPMFGSGAGMLEELLGDRAVSLHNEYNPGFQRRPPEPVEKNLPELPAFIRDQGCSLGIANDGDADRVAMFDENGRYVDSHQILCLLTRYMAKTNAQSGELVKTVSTTDMMRKQAEAYGLPISTTPIGFKYITEKMLAGDVLVCGEESGGIAVKGHLAERDGLYIGLLVAEMCARREMKLSELVQELFDEFGPHHNYRNDMHTTEARKNGMIDFCRAGKLRSIGDTAVTQTDQTDGIKHWLADGSWLLVRASGTEPVLRIYAEADRPERAKMLVDEVSRMVEEEVFAAG